MKTSYSDAGRVGEDPTQSAPKAFRANQLAPKLSGVSSPSVAHAAMPVNAMGNRSNLEGATVEGRRTSTRPNAKEVSEGFDDEDLGSAGLSIIPEYGIALACGKDGIAYEVNLNNMGKTKPADFAHAATNYAKLVRPPVWYTYTPDPNIDAAPRTPAHSTSSTTTRLDTCTRLRCSTTARSTARCSSAGARIRSSAHGR